MVEIAKHALMGGTAVVKTVNIFGVKHKVIIDNKLLEKYLEQIDSYSIDEIRGLYDDDERAIYIRDDMS
jgi:hypothetical protein